MINHLNSSFVYSLNLWMFSTCLCTNKTHESLAIMDFDDFTVETK